MKKWLFVLPAFLFFTGVKAQTNEKDTTTDVSKVVSFSELDHDFGKIPVEKRDYIDYIFVSNTIETDKFEVLPEKLDGVFLSDHVPVVAKIKVN